MADPVTATLIILSAGATIAGGQAQAASLKSQERGALLQARAEELRGREEALQVKGEIESVQASQEAYNAARGILSGTGSAEAARQTSSQKASQDINAIRFGASTRSNNQKSRAAGLKSERRATQFQTIANLGQIAASGYTPKSNIPKKTTITRNPYDVGRG